MSEDEREDSQTQMRKRLEKLTGKSAEERWKTNYEQDVNQSNPQHVNPSNLQNVKVVGLDIPFFG